MADPRLTVVEAEAAADGALYLDLADPASWLAAERALQVLPFVAEWVPVALGAWEGARCAEELASWREDVERTARERGLLPVRWPPEVPFDGELPALAATYARSIGKSVAFVLAAARQAWCGGRVLDADTLLLAGAACEIHPRALLTAVGTRGTREALARATAQARERGVTATPAVWRGGRVWQGDAGLDEAAAAHAS